MSRSARVAAAAAALALALALPLAALAASPAERPVQGAADALARYGHQKYVHHCAGCHGLDGAGKPANGIPDMRGAIGHYLRTPEGRAFLVQVPGVASSPLSNREIVLVTHWMLRAFSAAEMPADALPYTEDEIATLRASAPVDVMAARARVIARLHELGHDVR